MMFFLFGKPDAEEPAADRLVEAEAVHTDVGGKAKSTSHLVIALRIENPYNILRQIANLPQLRYT